MKREALVLVTVAVGYNLELLSSCQALGSPAIVRHFCVPCCVLRENKEQDNFMILEALLDARDSTQ
ncbi:hypothetical protein E2C01_091877 [Portunus trituberculatus]|uniref:Uncharacterized protein n=1 Tax=Portunus trituberculatus TaxID=210409 RepID=A0A5B7JU49_PORTR|nr:hypothetical protein [Portunus trituberculatus]